MYCKAHPKATPHSTAGPPAFFSFLLAPILKLNTVQIAQNYKIAFYKCVLHVIKIGSHYKVTTVKFLKKYKISPLYCYLVIYKISQIKHKWKEAKDFLKAKR